MPSCGVWFRGCFAVLRKVLFSCYLRFEQGICIPNKRSGAVRTSKSDNVVDFWSDGHAKEDTEKEYMALEPGITRNNKDNRQRFLERLFEHRHTRSGCRLWNCTVCTLKVALYCNVYERHLFCFGVKLFQCVSVAFVAFCAQPLVEIPKSTKTRIYLLFGGLNEIFKVPGVYISQEFIRSCEYKRSSSGQLCFDKLNIAYVC